MPHLKAFVGNDVLRWFLPSAVAEFWSALGGKTEYQTSKSLQNTVMAPRLFGCSNKTGRLIVSHGRYTLVTCNKITQNHV